MILDAATICFSNSACNTPSSDGEPGLQGQAGKLSKPGKILVVDDDEGCRRLTSRVLTLHGYATVSACNGREALEVMRRERISLVLLDLMMPEMDGLGFVQAMRREAAWTTVPVLVLSGVADHEMAKAVKASGVQGFLVKSRYSIDDLLQTILVHLQADEGYSN